MLTQSKYFISDFIEIQRKSFQELLQKGLVEEFFRRNPITHSHLEVFFYPEYYQLNAPEYTIGEAVLKGKSYSSKLYIPVQLTDKKTKNIVLKWIFIGDLPLMTKRGNFILNGAPRVVVNQLIRSPGIYFQEKNIPFYTNAKDEKPFATFKRYYADFICLRGTWLRIEIDKEKNVWAQFKKGPKIPLLWLLYAMGLSQGMIFKCIAYPSRLLFNFDIKKSRKNFLTYVNSPRQAWKEIANLLNLQTNSERDHRVSRGPTKLLRKSSDFLRKFTKEKEFDSSILKEQDKEKSIDLIKFLKDEELGRKWVYNKFMNSRNYDLGKQGRDAFNRKLGLNISSLETTLTPQDLLYATDYLFKIEKGLKDIDDIDHLMNRKIRTSGELIQMQIGLGLVQLEKKIREKLKNEFEIFRTKSLDEVDFESRNAASLPKLNTFGGALNGTTKPIVMVEPSLGVVAASGENNPVKPQMEKKKDRGLVASKNVTSKPQTSKRHFSSVFHKQSATFTRQMKYEFDLEKISNNLISSKILNGTLREFFGTNPLSQFMDQINPLAEITHKRRLSSMGPGGVGRENAPMAIRSIHPTHYGRICPIETPEGKNTGLVNSLTTCARVTSNGFIETPFYKIYKGQVQKNAGIFYLNTDQEEKIKSAPADLSISSVGFLPKSIIPVRFASEFKKIQRNEVQFIGISPIQMISVATSLIPFLEHDDANRALMGSNMQRQAVPLIRSERPIVGTGLEGRAACDSGHVIQARTSGFVNYVSGKKIIVYTAVQLRTKFINTTDSKPLLN